MSSNCPYPSFVFYVDPTLPCKKTCQNIFQSLELVNEKIKTVSQESLVTIVLYPGQYILTKPVVFSHPRLIVSSFIRGAAEIAGTIEISDESYTISSASTRMTGLVMTSEQSRLLYTIVGHRQFSDTHIIDGVAFREISVTCQSEYDSEVFFEFQSLEKKISLTVDTKPSLLRVSCRVVNCFFQLDTLDTLMTLSGLDTFGMFNCTCTYSADFPPSSTPMFLVNDIHTRMDIENSFFSSSSSDVFHITSSPESVFGRINFINVQAVNNINFLKLAGNHSRVECTYCQLTCTNGVFDLTTAVVDSFYITTCVLQTFQSVAVQVASGLCAIRGTSINCLGGSCIDAKKCFCLIGNSQMVAGDTVVKIDNGRLDIIHLYGCRRIRCKYICSRLDIHKSICEWFNIYDTKGDKSERYITSQTHVVQFPNNRGCIGL